MAHLNPGSPEARKRQKESIGLKAKFLLVVEFDYLEQHRRFIELQFRQESRDLEERFAQEKAQLEPGDDRFSDAFTLLERTLPRLQWNAQFLVAYGVFEFWMYELCDEVQRRSGFELKAKDLGKQGIVRASNYLAKVAGVKTPFDSPEWDRALFLSKVRNVIAHGSGSVPVDEKAFLEKLSKEAPHLSLVEGWEDEKEVTLSSEFVRNAIATMRKVALDIADYRLYPST